MILVYHHRIWYFPVMGVKSVCVWEGEVVACFHVSKERVDIKRGMEEERGS